MASNHVKQWHSPASFYPFSPLPHVAGPLPLTRPFDHSTMKAVVENSSPVNVSRSLFSFAALDPGGFPHNVDNLVDIDHLPTGTRFRPVDTTYAQRQCEYFSSFPGTKVPVLTTRRATDMVAPRVDIPPFFRPPWGAGPFSTACGKPVYTVDYFSIRLSTDTLPIQLLVLPAAVSRGFFALFKSYPQNQGIPCGYLCRVFHKVVCGNGRSCLDSASGK